ncbi:testis-specific Y-encoded protein 2-like [Molossus molossus]|uniref:testis-specific Y-encoded protein 2-like n=1 Tax=Molossus molossus TaxID=27622 RepID=UPI0017475B1B|nr:testis-specific Y-encoded protein 2-like [Molossus molossus]
MQLLDPKQFVSHPDLSAMICEQDEKMLSHMITLKVEEVRHTSDCCKILLFFHKNPYFCNNVIVKEYLITLQGYRVSHCTPIQWSQHYEREVYSRWHQNSSLNFFNWFSNHNVAGSGRIAEIILKDLWRNPLKYYVRTRAPREGRRSRTGPSEDTVYYKEVGMKHDEQSTADIFRGPSCSMNLLFYVGFYGR